MNTEGERRVAEARSWLRQGYTTRAQVDALMADVAKHRGQAAANRLREDMREQWRMRKAWMPG